MTLPDAPETAGPESVALDPFSPLPSPAPVAASRPWRRYVVTGAFALLMASILGWLLYREHDALASIDLAVVWPQLIAGQILMLGGLCATAWIWASIMRAMGSGLPVVEHLHIYASTYLARHLPGTIWYVVGRGVLYSAHNEPARVVTVGSAIEMLVATMAGAVTALLFMTAAAARTQTASIVAMALVIVIGVVALRPRALRWLARRLRLPNDVHMPVRTLAAWVAIDGVVWCLGGLVVFGLSVALGGVEVQSLPYVLFTYAAVGTLSALVFFLPSNFGVTEVGLSLLLTPLMPSSIAVLVALLTRLLLTLYTALASVALLGLTTLWRRRHSRAAGRTAGPGE